MAAPETIRAGQIGTLSRATIHFGGARAMLWRNHADFLDLCSYSAAGDPTWVMAELEPGVEDYGTRYKGEGGRSPEREPGVNACIVYQKGVRAFLGGMKSSSQQVNVDLLGSEGRIQLNDLGAEIVRQTDVGPGTTPVRAQGTIVGIQAAIVNLFTSIETGRDVQSPPREARKTVAPIEAILASQAGGHVRVAVDDGP